MLRRIAALVAIGILLVVLVILVWAVQNHRKSENSYALAERNALATGTVRI